MKTTNDNEMNCWSFVIVVIIFFVSFENKRRRKMALYNSEIYWNTLINHFETESSESSFS